jgi:DNA/RNA-binding domain of Phe-tRNA-synthetase-like protein
MLLIHRALSQKGLKAASVEIRGVCNTPTPEPLRQNIAKRLNDVAVSLVGQDLNNMSVVSEYKLIYSQLGIPRSHVRPSIERFNAQILKGRPIVSINCVVDIYNMFSIERQMCFGAHDLTQITLPVHVQPLAAGTAFRALGGETETVRPGEYGYVESGASTIICRDNAVQGDSSKITLETKDIFLIVEAPASRADEELLAAAADTAALLTEYTGGTVRSSPIIAVPID